MRDLSIEARGLGKAYRLYDGNLRRLLELATLGRRRGHRELWALRGLDLEVGSGTVLGVCGANGAGKSTLLKILSGTTSPTEGAFRVRGRVMSLLELGLGFHMDLTGRENLRHHVMLLGYSAADVARNIDAIVDFSELGSFIDEPLRTYSSGMAMRLGFSVAAMLDPEVLVLDEVFAVGDVAFQKKCIDRIRSFKERNRTVLFCSHSIYDLRQFCDEVLWLRDGRRAELGDPTFVTGEYSSFMRSRADLSAEAAAGETDPGLPSVTDVRVFRLGGDEEVREITTGDSIEVRVRWRNPRPELRELNLGIGFVREDNVVCVGLGTHFDGLRLRGEGGEVTLRLPELRLLSGRYLVPVWLMDDSGAHRFEECLPDGRLVGRATSNEMGVFRPEHRWVIQPSPEPAEASEAPPQH
ncbi:MAG: ABC transporter ATP-binding protein [Planctomycetota bacterium]